MSGETEIRNAIITSAEITNDDHGILTAWVHLDFGGSGQGFGGRVLYMPHGSASFATQWNFCGHFIWRVLEIAGATEWSRLPGKAVRVKTSLGKPIESIGHILKDDWFNPSEDFEARS